MPILYFLLQISLYETNISMESKSRALLSSGNVVNQGNGVFILKNEIENGFTFANDQSVIKVSTVNISNIPEGFFSLSTLEYFDGDNYLQKILDTAFSNCINLKRVNLGSCNYVGARAFINCIKLVSVTGTGYFEIYYKSFYNCLSLKEFDFQHIRSTIGESAFENCISITEIKLGHDCLKAAFKNCYGFKKVECTSSIDIFGSDRGYTFQNCYNLAEFIGYYPDIGSYAFHFCISLSKYISKCNIDVIGYNAFYNCSLTNLDTLCLTKDSVLYESCFAYNNFSFINYPKVRGYGFSLGLLDSRR